MATGMVLHFSLDFVCLPLGLLFSFIGRRLAIATVIFRKGAPGIDSNRYKWDVTTLNIMTHGNSHTLYGISGQS